MKEMLGQAQAMAGTPDKVEWRIGAKEAREIGVVFLHLFNELGESRVECERLGESAFELKQERDSLKGELESVVKLMEGNGQSLREVERERDSLKAELDRVERAVSQSSMHVLALINERDSLKAKLAECGPMIVQFAGELKEMCQQLIDKSNRTSGGGVA